MEHYTDKVCMVDFVIGFFLAVAYWSANYGQIAESMTSVVIGLFFYTFLFFGGIILLWLFFTVIAVFIPLIRLMPCISGGLITIFFLSLFF